MLAKDPLFLAALYIHIYIYLSIYTYEYIA